jgi:putative SOS response-associated peptidase YedK
MCGRYQLGRAVPSVYARYAHLGVAGADDFPFQPGLNIAPATFNPVVFRMGTQTIIQPMRWGFVPGWTKSLDALKSKPFNARSEGVMTSSFFCDAFRKTRCLVPSTGFYEWKGEKRPKQPFLFQLREADIFSFAGLWASWRDPATGMDIRTYTILTTEPNALTAEVHNRMPVILRQEDEARWLDPATPCDELPALMRPYPAEAMTMRAVAPDLSAPLPETGDLFSGF